MFGLLILVICLFDYLFICTVRHYNEYACHEVNLYVYHKDETFFRDVIRPFLQNKLQKTFVDEWLLCDHHDSKTDSKGLMKWIEPKRFQSLNIVEKLLLARKVRPTGTTQSESNLLTMIEPRILTCA